MTTRDEFTTSMVEAYLYDADGWSESDVRRRASDFYAESADASVVDDDELMELAEEAYSSRRDWPECRSIRDGISQLAHEALHGGFISGVESALSDFGDFEALFKVHPYKGKEPDAEYSDDDVDVFWDDDHHVAIKTVPYNGTDFYLDVSGDYDFEEDALLQLKRSARGQEDGDGGKENAA
jgi:hypothetical protein